jgi:hypothetical protein
MMGSSPVRVAVISVPTFFSNSCRATLESRVSRALAEQKNQQRLTRFDTAAMSLMHHGVDLTVIALWLGHESSETNQIYLHADMQLKGRALTHARRAASRRHATNLQIRCSSSWRLSNNADNPSEREQKSPNRCVRRIMTRHNRGVGITFYKEISGHLQHREIHGASLTQLRARRRVLWSIASC